MMEFLRANSPYITLIFLITGCLVGWFLFDKNDWSGK